ncbi:MAG: SEC-C metal-binding domain-containing protein [Actinomycetota bacterium]
MAGEVEELPDRRRYARWWEWLPARVAALEGESGGHDWTIRRLSPDEIGRNADLRNVATECEVEPGDLLAYLAHAEGRFGRYRIVAVFLVPPDVGNPHVFCLDGPRAIEASEHRNGEAELCLFYKGDPPERRWTHRDGLCRLFDLARRHVTGEYIWRTTGAWPIEEAPHGETDPAPPDPSLALPRLRKPGRNEPCTCGSGRKAKKCCWR